MILTPDLVFIHHPKTGGTFVTEALRRLYEPASGEDRRPGPVKRLFPRAYRDVNKHGTCADIPRSHRNKPILACVRNPFDRYVSQYEFAYWKHSPRPEWDLDAIRRSYPSYPEITFAEYVRAANSFMRVIVPPESALTERIGVQTEQFVLRFFRDPDRMIGAIDEPYLDRRGHERDMFPVRFLRTDRLNEDLHDALVAVGVAPERVAFIREMKRVFPPRGGRGETKPWERYYDDELREDVRRREALLLRLFPEFDEAGTAA